MREERGQKGPVPEHPPRTKRKRGHSERKPNEPGVHDDGGLLRARRGVGHRVLTALSEGSGRNDD